MTILDLSTKNSIFREIAILIYLAQRRAVEKEIEITTTQLAKFFSISQQTASRCLQELNRKKIVTWKSTPKGSFVQLTSNGISILEQLRFELEKALHPDLSYITLKGRVVTGTGQGKYYISRPSYLKSFQTKLGFTPYHGTLNIRINAEDKSRLDLIRGTWPTIITGFEGEEREFGDVLCYPLEVVNLNAKAAGIKPTRTHHGENVLEIISEVGIREKMKLKDGDEIIIKFSLEQNEFGVKMTGIDDKLVLKQIYINSLKGINRSLHTLSQQLGLSSELVKSLIDYLMEEASIEEASEDNYILTNLGRKQLSIILTGGTFDILHVGHLFTFEQSKLLGDVLVVVLATDKNVKKLKNHPPTNSQEDRTEMVDQLKTVDAAIVGDETDYMKMIELIEPDIITLGYDQKHDEKDLYNSVSKKGYPHVKIVRLQKHVSGKSTSKIVQEIIKHNYRE